MRFTALWLAALCILVFILQQVFTTEPFLLIKDLTWSEPWRILTSIFAHSNLAHLLSNLFALVLFGLILEGRIGAKRVLWLFLISGILINMFPFYERSLGASGAIYGLIGALILLRPGMVIWVNWMPMPMFVAGIIWLIQDAIGVFIPDGVGNLAHIGGLGIGIIAGIYWRKKGYGDRIRRQKRKRDPELEKQLDEWEEKYMR
ncbi:rhomboid family intramembrane serine protease [Candidatus Woesearchaeota archaeon]|nr:rhomboid family intramembrane serine protease [Candidatus Woesearchaeota archaeon]